MGTDVNVTVTARELDSRAIAVGAVAEALVMLFPLLVGTWIYFAALGPVVGGIVAGWWSRSFENEAFDGAAAAFFGTFATLVGIALLIWFRLPGVSVDVRLDLILFMALFGVFVAVMVGTFVGAVGAVVAHATATVRRRSAIAPDRL